MFSRFEKSQRGIVAKGSPLISLIAPICPLPPSVSRGLIPAAPVSQRVVENAGDFGSRDRISHPVPPSDFPSDMTLADVLGLYLLPELSHAGSDHRKKLRKAASCLSDFLKRPAVVADLADKRALNRWLASLALTGLSSATVNGRRTYIRIIQNEVFGKSAALDLKLRRQTEEKRLPVAWKIPEVERIIAACKAFDKTTRCDAETIHVGRRTLLALRLIYDSGVRINALMSRLKTDVVDGVLHVPACDQKTKKEQRFKLSAETLALIDSFPDVRGLLIPHTYTQERVDKPMTRYLTQILKTADLPTTPKHKWHCLRRVFATQLAKAVSMETAQHQLGHSCIETTRRYVDTSQLEQVVAVDVIPSLG